MTTDARETTDAGDLYRRWIEELWAGPPDRTPAVLEALVAADFVGHWPDREVRGREELGQVVAGTHGMFDGLTFRIELGPIVQGDLVAGRWSGEGAGEEGPQRFVGHDLLRVRDGRFVEYWVATVVLEA